ncbi:PREDICTED: uncharacterized protein LOC108764163 [Trachymyrmex cornetzi]|uniref:uncharacterized protein LOC108764163 n=1 Tax=Trachymyrmex cornetzi TaxID=471704 RepID=UPI00084ED42B|nr:PREDICTED: uncharacterized protein LOC108764163 [Trachymyrmex cornetzi]
MTMKKFWNMIASHLNEKGYNVTSSQCKSKMTGLKNTYKSVKDYNAKNGNSHRIWQYFDVMNEMFNKKPWMTPILILDSSNPTSSLSSKCSAENKIVDNKKDPSSYKTKICSIRLALDAHFGLIPASDPHYHSSLSGRAADRSRDALAQERPYILNVLGSYLPSLKNLSC